MKKSQVLEILQAMPDEFPVDELIEKLRVLQKTEADLRQVPGGHTHPEGAAGHQPGKTTPRLSDVFETKPHKVLYVDIRQQENGFELLGVDNNYQRYYVFKETYEQLEFDVPIINDFNYDPETLRRSIIGYYKRKDGTEVEFSAQVEDPTYQSLKKRMDA